MKNVDSRLITVLRGRVFALLLFSVPIFFFLLRCVLIGHGDWQPLFLQFVISVVNCHSSSSFIMSQANAETSFRFIKVVSASENFSKCELFNSHIYLPFHSGGFCLVADCLWCVGGTASAYINLRLNGMARK